MSVSSRQIIIQLDSIEEKNNSYQGELPNFGTAETAIAIATQ